MSYLNEVMNPAQTSPIVGETMVQNNAGGYVYQVDKWTFLERFSACRLPSRPNPTIPIRRILDTITSVQNVMQIADISKPIRNTCKKIHPPAGV